MRQPLFHCNGTCSTSQIFFKRAYSSSTLVSISVFYASAGILSGPADLPFFNCSMAWYISFVVGGWQLIGRSTLAGGKSGGSCGAGLFSNSPKYSIHLLFWPSSSGTGFLLCPLLVSLVSQTFQTASWWWCTVPVDFLSEPPLLFLLPACSWFPFCQPLRSSSLSC